MNPGHGFGDLGLRGRHGETGDEVEIADGGPPQLEGRHRQTLAALCSEERDHVAGLARQAGQGVLVAPGAPSPDSGAIGAPRVVGLGAARIRGGGSPGGAKRAVITRDLGDDGVIEPALDLAWGGADRRHLTAFGRQDIAIVSVEGGGIIHSVRRFLSGSRGVPLSVCLIQ